MPGTFRTHEAKGGSAGAEPQRIVLYLPVPALEEAEAQSIRLGAESVQRYCEALLVTALRTEQDRERSEHEEVRRGRLGGLRAISGDPDYLAEWTATLLDRDAIAEIPTDLVVGIGGGVGEPDDSVNVGNDPDPRTAIVERPAAEVVLRHAGVVGEDPDAFLTALRRGEAPAPEAGQELLRALADLEAEHRGAPALSRPLAYALHKLAFEGQVLVTDSGAGPTVDEGTIDLLRVVQEGVDRVLSGQDIRYFSPQ